VKYCKVHVIDWLLDHTTYPDDVDLLALSRENVWGSEVFEYLFDTRGLRSNAEDLMAAASLSAVAFDAAVVLERCHVPLPPTYLEEAIGLEDIGRIRFALSHGQEPTVDNCAILLDSTDGTVLSEVLLARKVGGVLTEVDRSRVGDALPKTSPKPTVMKVLTDHSFFDP
jgi:hypothetical protein